MIFLILPTSLTAQAADGACAQWGEVAAVGEAADGALSELSGLAVSRAQAAIWAHNDSGDGARLFALSADGADLGVFEVTDADNDDWEDLALGLCPEAADRARCACLYIADIGDNDLERDRYTLYRTPEPAAGTDGATDPVTATWFVYPDGPHDAEALLIHPLTGEAVVITKGDGLAGVYTFPDAPPDAAAAAAPVTLSLAGTLDLGALGLEAPEVTAGDVSPDGLRAALRTPDAVLIYALGGAGLAEALVAPDAAPEVLAGPPSELGEALAFDDDGERIWLADEGAGAALWALDCEDFSPAEGPSPHPLEDCAVEEEKGCGGCGGGGGGGLLSVVLVGVFTVGVLGRGRGAVGGGPGFWGGWRGGRATQWTIWKIF